MSSVASTTGSAGCQGLLVDCEDATCLVAPPWSHVPSQSESSRSLDSLETHVSVYTMSDLSDMSPSSEEQWYSDDEEDDAFFFQQYNQVKSLGSSDHLVQDEAVRAVQDPTRYPVYPPQGDNHLNQPHQNDQVYYGPVPINFDDIQQLPAEFDDDNYDDDDESGYGSDEDRDVSPTASEISLVLEGISPSSPRLSYSQQALYQGEAYDKGTESKEQSDHSLNYIGIVNEMNGHSMPGSEPVVVELPEYPFMQREMKVVDSIKIESWIPADQFEVSADNATPASSRLLPTASLPVEATSCQVVHGEPHLGILPQSPSHHELHLDQDSSGVLDVKSSCEPSSACGPPRRNMDTFLRRALDYVSKTEDGLSSSISRVSHELMDCGEGPDIYQALPNSSIPKATFYDSDSEGLCPYGVCDLQERNSHTGSVRGSRQRLCDCYHSDSEEEVDYKRQRTHLGGVLNIDLPLGTQMTKNPSWKGIDNMRSSPYDQNVTYRSDGVKGQCLSVFTEESDSESDSEVLCPYGVCDTDMMNAHDSSVCGYKRRLCDCYNSEEHSGMDHKLLRTDLGYTLYTEVTRSEPMSRKRPLAETDCIEATHSKHFRGA